MIAKGNAACEKFECNNTESVEVGALISSATTNGFWTDIIKRS
jgi:hypothetical protein